MRYFILVFVVLCASCGAGPIEPTNPTDPFSKQEHKKIVEYDNAFKTYIDSFESDWGLSIKDLTVEFDTIEQDEETKTLILGECTLQTNVTPHIAVDTGLWQNLSDTRRKLLMYHELGHCVLFRKHVEGINTSIMNPTLISAFTFSKNKDYFIEELFDDNKYGSWDVKHLTLWGKYD